MHDVFYIFPQFMKHIIPELILSISYLAFNGTHLTKPRIRSTPLSILLTFHPESSTGFVLSRSSSISIVLLKLEHDLIAHSPSYQMFNRKIRGHSAFQYEMKHLRCWRNLDFHKVFNIIIVLSIVLHTLPTVSKLKGYRCL